MLYLQLSGLYYQTLLDYSKDIDRVRRPAVIDTEPYDIEYSDLNSAKFTKESILTNASGTVFYMIIVLRH